MAFVCLTNMTCNCHTHPVSKTTKKLSINKSNICNHLKKNPIPYKMGTCWSYCIKHFSSQVLTLIFFKRGPNVWDSSMISAKHLLYIWSLWKFGPLWLAASREDSCCSWKKKKKKLPVLTIIKRHHIKWSPSIKWSVSKVQKITSLDYVFSNCLNVIHIKWSYGVIYLSIQFQMKKHRRYKKIIDFLVYFHKSLKCWKWTSLIWGQMFFSALEVELCFSCNLY